VERRALLAAVAEPLCTRFGLPGAALDAEDRVHAGRAMRPIRGAASGDVEEERMSYASPVYRKRNVVFKERSLIVI
jgi:hypothetical protein